MEKTEVFNVATAETGLRRMVKADGQGEFKAAGLSDANGNRVFDELGKACMLVALMS